ncbi:MAG TPA: DUF192 domain-containing protein [Rhodospirillaceae bacterium]|mgnify:CR=1 FL=1|jgi:uncharacterized membrane protein (UPF0127 family)|nr:DUF192 domain-containing protein [Alphaproteobacteria bacterium]HBH26971.1 DUF192 domain-containing protein [Rhodospirillaceae bacterium]
MRRLAFVFIVLWFASFHALAEVVEVRTAAGAQHRFEVEVAATPEARARGLMGREALAPDGGMLFLFPSAGPLTAFWMKDTPIPLDLLFFSADGALIGLHADARPGDRTPIPAPPGTAAVLEIPGSTAARLGLGAGATLLRPHATGVP